MAKNLQTVLNSVVNELLQESSPVLNPDAAIEQAGELENQQNALTTVRNAEFLAKGIKDGTIRADLARAALKGGWAGDEADTKFTDEFVGRAGGWGNRWSQNQAFADELAKQPQESWYQQNQGWVNPTLAGLGGAALAAGAGALYLRKKQREANRAAGR